MPNQLLFLLPLLLFGCTTSKSVAPLQPPSSPLSTKLSVEQLKLVTDAMGHFPNQSQFSIALVQGNEVQYLGLVRQNDQLAFINNQDKVFEIGSLTKVFTSHLLLAAINNNKIASLKATVQQHLDFQLVDPTITFQQLANHTAGLPKNLSAGILQAKNPYQRFTKEKAVQLLANKKTYESTPGSQYNYSNLGIGLLGYAMSRIYQLEYEILLQQEIFAPLNMQYSTTDRSMIQERLIPGYNWKGKATPNWDLAFIGPAGAILSCTADLVKYAQWNFDALNNELQAMQKTSFNINKDYDIALGWHIVKGQSKEDFLWHNGGTGGYKSSMAIQAKSRKSVIILTNIGATNNPKRGVIDQLCFDLIKSLK